MFLEPSRLNATPEEALINYQKREKRRLVRRQHVFGIAAAWIITVPAAALVAGASLHVDAGHSSAERRRGRVG